MYVSNDSNDSINIGYLDRKPGNFLEPFYRRIIHSMKSTDGLNENHLLHILLLKTGWKKKIIEKSRAVHGGTRQRIVQRSGQVIRRKKPVGM